MDALLRTENLHYYYGSIHAVKDVNFEVHQGEIVALIGANGAGKNDYFADNLWIAGPERCKWKNLL